MSYSLTQFYADNYSSDVEEGVEYDYDNFSDLPCEWVPSLKRWRDVETHLIVSDREAFDRNDTECEKQEQDKRDRDEEDWQRDRDEWRNEVGY